MRTHIDQTWGCSYKPQPKDCCSLIDTVSQDKKSLRRSRTLTIAIYCSNQNGICENFRKMWIMHAYLRCSGDKIATSLQMDRKSMKRILALEGVRTTTSISHFIKARCCRFFDCEVNKFNNKNTNDCRRRCERNIVILLVHLRQWTARAIEAQVALEALSHAHATLEAAYIEKDYECYGMTLWSKRLQTSIHLSSHRVNLTVCCLRKRPTRNSRCTYLATTSRRRCPNCRPLKMESLCNFRHLFSLVVGLWSNRILVHIAYAFW